MHFLGMGNRLLAPPKGEHQGHDKAGDVLHEQLVVVVLVEVVVQ